MPSGLLLRYPLTAFSAGIAGFQRAFASPKPRPSLPGTAAHDRSPRVPAHHQRGPHRPRFHRAPVRASHRHDLRPPFRRLHPQHHAPHESRHRTRRNGFRIQIWSCWSGAFLERKFSECAYKIQGSIMKTPDKIREQNRKSYARNVEKRRAYALQYRADHLEECREKDRKRLAEHGAEINVERRKRRIDNPLITLIDSAHSRKWRSENTERARGHGRKYYAGNKEKILASHSEYRKNHREETRIYRREYDRLHPEKRILKNALLQMFDCTSLLKTGRAQSYIGCSPGFLRNYLESLFKPGMSWENYGEWHVDHIVPLSWFPFDADPSLLFVASHWSNLQPLWGKENMSKGNRYAA
jgi:hypothetical protein